MSSLNEIAYNILNLLRGGRSDHDEHYDLDQIKYNIKYYRNLFIRRDLQRYGVRQEPFEQDLNNLEFEEISNARYGPDDQNLLRTTKQIPNLLRVKNRQALTYVGPTDESKNYPVIQYHEARYQNYNKWTSNKNRAFHVRNNIYLMGRYADNIHNSTNRSSEKFDVKGIFADPEEVIEFKIGDFYDHDEEFPTLPEDYVQRITQGLTSGELQLMVQTQSDVNLNQRNDIKTKQSN